MVSSTKDLTIYSNGGHPYTLRAEFVETDVSTENNTSTLSCTAKLIPVSNYWDSTQLSYLYVYWHDDRENVDKLVNSTSFAGISSGETKTTTGNITVYHKEDGKLSGYAYAYFVKGGTNSSFAPNTGVIPTDALYLTTIDRYPLITSAPNFTDEENPTITYSTTLGFEGATVEVSIANSDGSPISNISYRSVNVADGTYTFNLTTTERNALRSLTPNSNTMTVQFKIRTTTTDSQVFTNYVNRQLSIVNANPTFTYTVTETNAKVVSLLGTNNANTIIKLASILSIPTTFETKKYSTAKTINIKEGITGDVIQTMTTPTPTSPKTFTLHVSGYSNSGKFSITLTDSRDNATTQSDTSRTILDYIPVKILNYNFKRYNPTSSNIILNAEFTYQASIGTYSNTPVVSWKLDDGSYITIPSTNYSIDTVNNKLTITDYELTNALVYTSQGQFYLKIEDSLTEAQDGGANGLVLKGIPTYDVGEHDLQVNGDLYVADTDGENGVNILDIITLHGSDISEINDWFRIREYTSSITVAGNSTATIDMGNISTPTGYTFLGVVSNNSGYGDQWIVSYSNYNSKIQAVVSSRYSSSLTNDLVCYAIYLKTSFYNNILLS